VLDATQQRLEQANKELDKLVGVRTRMIQRRAGAVSSLPEETGGPPAEEEINPPSAKRTEFRAAFWEKLEDSGGFFRARSGLCVWNRDVRHPKIQRGIRVWNADQFRERYENVCRTVIFMGVNLKVEEGDRIGLVGANARGNPRC
jgi:ATPase subunit of ABC transporter with duplicated ATPase domains